VLFHVTHTNTPESCLAHNPKKVREIFGKMMTPAQEPGGEPGGPLQ
jgi:hypothetical protein